MNENERLVIIHTEIENHKTKKITIDRLRDWIIVPVGIDIKVLFKEFAKGQYKNHRYTLFSSWLIKKKGIGRQIKNEDNIDFVDYNELIKSLM